MPQPAGRREVRNGVTCLVYVTELAHPVDRVWRAVATPEGLAPWLGTFEGDPASGEVRFRMTAEGDDVPEEVTRIRRCEPLRGFDIRVGEGTGTEVWDLALDLEPGDGDRVSAADGGPRTRLTFVHRAEVLDGIDMVGPGWDYYLDRLRLHLDGGDLATIDFDDYLPGAVFYAELFGVEPTGLAGHGGAGDD